MVSKSNYLWISPLIGGVLSLIALATPATYFNQMGLEFYAWMWGLFSIRLYDYYYGTYSTVDFIDNEKLLITSGICSFLVFVSSVVLIYYANLNRTRKRTIPEVKNKWLGLATLLIISTATWMITYEVEAYIETNQSWWNNYDPGFGVIGVFIGASITIIGTIVAIFTTKEREELIPIYKKGPIPEPPTFKLPDSCKFCPICGIKIQQETFKFCPGCGFKIKYP